MIKQFFRLLAPASGRGTPADRRGLIVVVAFFIVAGCGQQRRKDADMLDRGPDFEQIVVPGEYADAAIRATGGLQQWAKTVKVQIDCVVTFYQPDGSFYLTEHRFNIYPWSNSIEVFAREPLGIIAWQLSDGQFKLLAGDPALALGLLAPAIGRGTPADRRGLTGPAEAGPAMGVSCRDYAEAILKITTAPVQFLQPAAVFVKGPAPVKMEGLWYHPIEQISDFQLPIAGLKSKIENQKSKIKSDRQGADVKPYWSKVVYYQNMDSPAAGGQGSLVDLLWLADIEQGKFLAVRGYDYKEVQKACPEPVERDGVLLPTKIEVFRTDARAVSRERLVKIDLR